MIVNIIEITPDISLNDCEHNKEITPDISLLLLVLFACEYDSKTKKHRFWGFKKVSPEGTCCKLEGTWCCKLEGTQVL